jgi:hypothetical protein
MSDLPSLVTCPHCAREFPLTDAVAQRIRGELSREFEERRRVQEAALADRERTLKERTTTLEAQAQSLDTEISRRLGAERQRLLAEAAKQEREKLGVELRDMQNQLAEQRQKLDSAHQTELNLRKQQRALEEQARQLELEMARSTSNAPSIVIPPGSRPRRTSPASEKEQPSQAQQHIEALKRRNRA